MEMGYILRTQGQKNLPLVETIHASFLLTPEYPIGSRVVLNPQKHKRANASNAPTPESEEDTANRPRGVKLQNE
jgi:hypothetical protein